MDILEILKEYPLVIAILSGLGGLVVLGQAVVALTPSPSDDAWFNSLEEKPGIGHIIKFLKSFAPIQKK